MTRRNRIIFVVAFVLTVVGVTIAITVALDYIATYQRALRVVEVNVQTTSLDGAATSFVERWELRVTGRSPTLADSIGERFGVEGKTHIQIDLSVQDVTGSGVLRRNYTIESDGSAWAVFQEGKSLGRSSAHRALSVVDNDFRQFMSRWESGR